MTAPVRIQRRRKYHQVADVFRLLDGVEFDALVADIELHGLREPITLHPDGSILDGRNRYLACLTAKIEPDFVEWDGQGTPGAFVMSKNLARRHLSVSQRAMIAAKLANFDQGRPHKKGQNCPLKITEAAQALSVGERSVKDAKAVIDRGGPALHEAVEASKVSVSRAAATVRAKVPGPPPAPKKKAAPGAHQARQNAAPWRRLRDALEALHSLPDIAAIAKSIVPASQRDLILRRLPVVIGSLGAFETALKSRKESTR